MSYKILRKTVFLATISLASCFSMETQQKEEKFSYYVQAQDYFRLSSECDSNTEQEAKQVFAKLAIAELEEGVEKRERDSIYCMMEFYKDGLGSVVKRDMEKYAALKKLLQEEEDKKLKQILESENIQ